MRCFREAFLRGSKGPWSVDVKQEIGSKKGYQCDLLAYLCGFIYLGFYITFNTVQVILRRVVGRAEENQYIQFVRVLYCKLPTNGKQLLPFPLEAVPGTEPQPQRWEARVLPLCYRGPSYLCGNFILTYSRVIANLISYGRSVTNYGGGLKFPFLEHVEKEFSYLVYRWCFEVHLIPFAPSNKNGPCHLIDCSC